MCKEILAYPLYIEVHILTPIISYTFRVSLINFMSFIDIIIVFLLKPVQIFENTDLVLLDSYDILTFQMFPLL